MGKELVNKALKLIRKGKVFDLGMDINRRIPNAEIGLFPFDMFFSGTPEKNRNILKEIESNSKVSFSTEVVTGPVHISTHIDALCHIQYDGKIYNNNNAKDVRTDFGWNKFGAEKIPPIVGRGILIDIAKYKGLRKLKNDYEIGLQEVKDYLDKKNIKLKKGDIVCFRTGKIKDFYKKNYLKNGPGISIEVAIWVAKKGAKILGIDYASIERNPMSNFNNCVHMQLLYKKGVYIIENLNLEELSKECISEFFMICSAPKLTGCSASWIRPVAIA